MTPAEQKAALDAENDGNRLATVHLVEANGNERHHLWLVYAEAAGRWGHGTGPRVDWKSISLGYGKTIGKLAGMPVFVSITFARVNSHVIAFYEPTSQVVDHRMVERWLVKEFPAAKGRKTDAQNFHNCILELAKLDAETT